MSEDAAALVRATGFVVALTVLSYLMLKSLPAVELYVAGARERAAARWREAQAWHRATSEVLFEAYYATREAAD